MVLDIRSEDVLNLGHHNLFSYSETSPTDILAELGFSNGGATYIIGKIIAKDNLNIEKLMKNFKNLLLYKYSTEFFDIAPK